VVHGKNVIDESQSAVEGREGERTKMWAMSEGLDMPPALSQRHIGIANIRR
jgi:hypothetical protein